MPNCIKHSINFPQYSNCHLCAGEKMRRGLRSSSVLKEINKQREEILKAFIAETGLLPSECEQVTQGNRWWVQRRIQP